MFGLEGSGFIVSLAMTFFLVGLIMYYVRQRLNDQEKQLNQLVSIIPVMSQQLQIHESILKNNKNEPVTRPEESPKPLHSIPEEPEKINVSDNDNEDSESESDSEDDSEEDSDSDNNDDVKNIKLGNDIPELTVADIEAELGSQLQAMAMQEALGQVRVVSVHAMDTGTNNVEHLEDLGHNIEIIDDKEASLNAENDDDDDESDDDSDDSDDDSNHEGADKEANPEEIKTLSIAEDNAVTLSPNVDDTPQETSDVDYSKMAVAALREMVVSRNLANSADVSKLKKKKLLELLK